MKSIWCNGEWREPKDFPASPMDRGSILGLGLFETLLALDGVPVFMDRHLARFQQACARLDWQVALPDLRAILVELLERNNLAKGRARLRMTLTAGAGSVRDTAMGKDSLLWLAATPAGDAGGSVTADISPWPRNERSPLAGMKCASYAENLLALDHARRRGFDETLFLNTAGELCEAATSNVFLVREGTLLTPSLESGCLPGITRELVLELAAGCDVAAEQRTLTAGDLHAADEVFLTTSIRGLVGVSRVASRNVTQSAVTDRLRESWIAEAAAQVRF